jgi:peptide/nickel transport system ATP-binding protein
MYLGKLAEIAPKSELYRNPLHPYTQALLSANPVINPDKKKERIILKGDVPSPINPPAGCRFDSRCFKEFGPCKSINPELKEVSPGHMVACHLI